MAKFYGPVGYIVDEKIEDVTREVPVERYYKGDLVKNSRRLEKGEGLNDNVTLSNRISIVADPYAYSHIFAIRYVRWMDAYWEVSEIDVEPPRLILSLGGVYNGETAK